MSLFDRASAWEWRVGWICWTKAPEDCLQSSDWLPFVKMLNGNSTKLASHFHHHHRTPKLYKGPSVTHSHTFIKRWVFKVDGWINSWFLRAPPVPQDPWEVHIFQSLELKWILTLPLHTTLDILTCRSFVNSNCFSMASMLVLVPALHLLGLGPPVCCRNTVYD